MRPVCSLSGSCQAGSIGIPHWKRVASRLFSSRLFSRLFLDQVIELTGVNAEERCPHPLRRIEAIRPDTGETLVFLTNHLTLGASTIAAIYKDRWQVELFFKAIKQNLKVKTFIGTTPNAVKTQLWCALIAILLLRYLQQLSRFGWSMSNLVALLRMNLFTHRDLRTWLDEPFAVPPDPADVPRQTALAFA